jgi:PAS domain S-box-containing protein
MLLVTRPPRPRSRAVTGSKLLACIVASSDDDIIGKTLDGVITTWNSSAERIYGYRAEEIIGHSVSLLIPAGLPDEMDEILNRIRVGERVDHYETRRRRKDGVTIAVSLTVSPIHDESGKVVGASAIARDITDRQRVQDGDRVASQYARGLIEASRDPLVTIGLEGKITEVNEATIQMTGVAREDLAGTDFSDCFTEPDRAREGYLQVLGQGFVTDYPLTIRHTGGELTEVLYNASVYRDAGGQPLGVFAAVRDVTAWKRAESEVTKQRARELDRLAELERFQQLTVGRELRMIGLKNEIEHLRAAARGTSRDAAGGT